MQAVGREFSGIGIGPNGAGIRGLLNEVAHELLEATVRVPVMITLVDERCQFGTVVLMRDLGKELEYVTQAAQLVAGARRYVAKKLQVPRHLALVPRDQDRLHTGEVLVQRRSSDAGGLGDLQHRDAADAALLSQGSSGIQYGIAYRVAVLAQRRGPACRHERTLPCDHGYGEQSVSI